MDLRTYSLAHSLREGQICPPQIPARLVGGGQICPPFGAIVSTQRLRTKLPLHLVENAVLNQRQQAFHHRRRRSTDAPRAIRHLTCFRARALVSSRSARRSLPARTVREHPAQLPITMLGGAHQQLATHLWRTKLGAEVASHPAQPAQAVPLPLRRQEAAGLRSAAVLRGAAAPRQAQELVARLAAAVRCREPDLQGFRRRVARAVRRSVPAQSRSPRPR